MTSISQKEYLKKYLSGGDVKKKKKRKVAGASANIKRSVIVDDDIDLKSMRPLEDDEVELYQMDEDAPQIAGIIDERPPEVRAQEYYSAKRWKVFGGEDGVNVKDSMDQDRRDNEKTSITVSPHEDSESENGNQKSKIDKWENGPKKEKIEQNKTVPNYKVSHGNRMVSKYEENALNDQKCQKNTRINSDSDESPPRVQKGKTKHKDDSDVSPPRKHNQKSKSDSDVSPPRKKYDKDSDESPPRRESRKASSKRSTRFEERGRGKVRNRSHSNSPSQRDKTKKLKYKSDSDESPSRRGRDKSDSDASPPRKKDKYKKYEKDSPPKREKYNHNKDKLFADVSPPRRRDKYTDKKSFGRARRRSSSDSDTSPHRRQKENSPKARITRKRFSRSRSPPDKNPFHNTKNPFRDKPLQSSGSSGKQQNDRRHAKVFDSPPRRRQNSESDSDMSPPRKSLQVNDRPTKKVLYKPNDDSSSDEKSKGKKMKTTLDGKQAGLQDAKQLKKELSDLKMKEDSMFSKMDASVSGVGAAPVKRDRKTGQIRDLEKEKEAQKEKEAKESVVNEKYYKWGKGIKQTEDASVRAAEMMKEMNKPLARYVDDKDLDEFLKAQEREGDPMLEYIKRKQSESTPLQGEKPIYKGSWNPNRFNIRPGYRWDGVVRSNGYEQEWFKMKNAKKARDEEAYKWSTSDM